MQSLWQSQEEKRETSSSIECRGANAIMLGVPCSLACMSISRLATYQKRAAVKVTQGGCTDAQLPEE